MALCIRVGIGSTWLSKEWYDDGPVHLTGPQAKKGILWKAWTKTHSDRLQRWQEVKVEDQAVTLSYVAMSCGFYVELILRGAAILSTLWFRVSSMPVDPLELED